MKATPRLSTQIYGVEMGGRIEKEKWREEAIGAGMRAVSLRRSRSVGGRGGGEARLFSQRTQIDLWPSSG